VENTNEAAQSTCLSLMRLKLEVGIHILHCERGFESLPGWNAIPLSHPVRNNHLSLKTPPNIPSCSPLNPSIPRRCRLLSCNWATV
jgi:hypothetical protein